MFDTGDLRHAKRRMFRVAYWAMRPLEGDREKGISDYDHLTSSVYLRTAPVRGLAISAREGYGPNF